MIILKAICDDCESPINGSGYSLNVVNEQSETSITIRPFVVPAQAGIQKPNNKHFCGQACLIRQIGNIIDGLPGSKIKKGKGEKNHDIIG